MSAQPVKSFQTHDVPTAANLEARFEPYQPAIVLALGLLARIWLIHGYPIIFGGDSVVRLVFRDRIFLAHQLPLLQASIHYLSMVSEDPLLVRYFMAVVGAIAGLGFYYLTSALFGRGGAFYAALIFASNPFILAFSIVPYQEILMLAGLFFAFYFFFMERWIAASLCLGAASLTRYEAWVACFVFVVAFLLQRRPRPREFAKAVALFGWAPLGWIVFNLGIAPSGTYVVDTAVSAERLFRYVYLGWITLKNTPIPVLPLAILGFVRFWNQGMLRSRRYLMLVAFLGLFLGAILFSAHGDRERPDRWVSAREAHILLSAVAALAGLGFYRLGRRWRAPVLVLCLVIGLFMADRFQARETAEPRLQLAYELAHFLDDNVAPGETVVTLTPPIPQRAIEIYLDRSEKSGGAAGRRKALRFLAQLDASPPDHQRTLVHSRLDRHQIRSLSTLPTPPQDRAAFARELEKWRAVPPADATPEWVAVWSDFEPTNTAESRLQDLMADRHPTRTLSREALAIGIYKLE